MEKTTVLVPTLQQRAATRAVAGVSTARKAAIIVANAVFSLSLVAAGAIGMLTANRGLGVEYPWSAFLWILGLISLFLIPLEICVIKRRRMPV